MRHSSRISPPPGKLRRGAFAGVAGLLLLCAIMPCAAATAETLGPTEVARTLYKDAVQKSVKLKRLSLFGRMCGVLSEEDSTIIQRNANAWVSEEAASLPSTDAEWARIYREGVFDGAFRSADPYDEKNEEACRRFAAPGGKLGKIMTWTGKPIEENGIRLSPRTFP